MKPTSVVDSSWNVMAHGDAWEGKWRGNWRMEWVASTLLSTSERGVSSITTADAHTSAASSWLNWRLRRFKWTRPFRRKTNSGFCACAITFQTQSTTDLYCDVTYSSTRPRGCPGSLASRHTSSSGEPACRHHTARTSLWNTPAHTHNVQNFYCCTEHFDDSITFIHQLTHYIYIISITKTLFSFDRSYMFRHTACHHQGAPLSWLKSLVKNIRS
jgi:hypothetical protein